ncbi:hypothetical protein Chor_009316 [Crotalus horridus]
MGVSRGCLLCVKVKMFVFNLIFWLGGCGVLGVGIWLAATQGHFATLSFSFPSLLAAGFFMATGAIIMVVGFLGCLGAATEHRCLLMTFFLVLSTLFLLELVGLLVFFTCRDKFDQYAQSNLKEGLKLYGTEDNVGLTKAWNVAQNEFRCCGVRNYTDWFEVLGIVFSMLMYCQVRRVEKYYD